MAFLGCPRGHQANFAVLEKNQLLRRDFSVAIDGERGYSNKVWDMWCVGKEWTLSVGLRAQPRRHVKVVVFFGEAKGGKYEKDMFHTCGRAWRGIGPRQPW
jgi:hypothetical protein